MFGLKSKGIELLEVKMREYCRWNRICMEEQEFEVTFNKIRGGTGATEQVSNE